eukprot:TRINITY_DN12497_c1_g1_i13.p5 TRINITY_DN12497_c1_g1~~TRINITY_DN12497_c1_g1_i13.p5  ORF type:complete len:100 (+),score=9.26 TRINITY_DN12497_c1_g1_i13:1351-1650(+)
MAWRASHWANWAFEIDHFDYSNNSIVVGKGDFQGARGGPGSGWFIMNFLEELDIANEYYYDRTTETLYLYANNSNQEKPRRGICCCKPPGLCSTRLAMA